jgi:2-iminobutanoate/2-iminopropanoate deaminase
MSAATRTTVATDGAPKAIGPYCQAVLDERAGVRTLWCAGQIALDPATMEIVPGDARAHTERVMRNIEAVLAAGGMSFGDVVRSTIYVADLAELPAVNEVYGSRFGGAAPPRSTVQVAGIPRGSRVEIEVTAVRDAGRARARPRRGARSGTRRRRGARR